MSNSNLDLVLSSIASQGHTGEKLIRLVANRHLGELCIPKSSGLELASATRGTDEELTLKVLSDALALCSSDKESPVEVCLDSSLRVGRILGFHSVTKGSSIPSIESTKESYESKGVSEEEDEKPKVSLTKEDEEPTPTEDTKVSLVKEEPTPTEEPENQEPEPEEPLDLSEDKLEKEIIEYYAPYTTGIIDELVKRYTELFSSGYEVLKPAGILSEGGICKVSGNKLTVVECTAATNQIYSILINRLGFREVSARSVVNIANIIYDSYREGVLIYFPNKLLEFAFGLEAPTGDNQDSVNTYTRHADAANWGKFSKGELLKGVTRLVERSMYGFVVNNMEGDNYMHPNIVAELGSYLKYLQSCLSLCIIFPEYKVANINGRKEVSSFKLRVCDPEGKILHQDLTPEIIQKAFMGGDGRDPYSSKPRVVDNLCVVEYSHEFNHAVSQAVPLFAYKALESLKEQGVGLSFDNLILGQAEDGSILRNKTHGVNISNHLTHFITAGSQAGKGVMTLNILASGLASDKVMIYLDRKPDMASLFKYLAPNMVVVNGGDIQKSFDSFNQWQDVRLHKVPAEALEAFGTSESWSALGDIVYMRTLKLAIGLLMIRGSGILDNLGGEKGILIVADEFSNFQRSYMTMFTQLTSIIPPTVLDKAKDSVANGKMVQTTFDRVYNDASYYALSYITSIMEDIRYLKVKKDAGYDPRENGRSDVFVIGQTLEKGLFNYEEFKDTFSNSSASGRYKTADARGLTKSSFDVASQSIPFNIVNFKTADAFFGRNFDDGRSKYLAQTDTSSKSYGKLDDKASNFAYLSSFDESTRQILERGKSNENIDLASRCTYFKPYLILNSSGMEDDCVKKMVDRVEKNAGVSKETLINENPSPNDPTRFNEAIGFLDYVKLAGNENYKATLEQSNDVFNYLVQHYLKYPGTWLEFVTDLSPEWFFTIEDLVSCAEKGDCALFHPETNPVFAEWYAFNPQRFGGNYEDPIERSERAMDSFFMDDGDTSEDFSDMNQIESDADARLVEAMGDNEVIPDDDLDSIDLGTPSLNEGMVNQPNGVDNETESRIQELLAELSTLGVDTSKVQQPTYNRAEPTSFGEDMGRLDYTDEVTSVQALSDLITKDIFSKFGTADRFTSFRVIGGALVVNEYYYRARIKDLYAKNIPYDVRRDINSGNIASLFNFAYLGKMSSLRVLEVDSETFAYDNIRPYINGPKSSSIGVDKLFRRIKTLDEIRIGGNTFRRSDFDPRQEQGIYYKMNKRDKLAYMADEGLSKFENKSWSFTKKSALSSSNFIIKTAKVAGGTSATLGAKAVRGTTKMVNLLARGIEDLLET